MLRLFMRESQQKSQANDEKRNLESKTIAYSVPDRPAQRAHKLCYNDMMSMVWARNEIQ